ncbi:MAG: methionine--tRNA ligase [Actinomycetota bacterium]|nr:methionine--tRNA ligase [Actinomycetota bacterium]
MIYITTPIYYVNDAPHIGHAYTTVVADVLTRYFRLKGEPVWFLTGTDEHGQNVARAAEAHGATPQEWADQVVQRYLEAWKLLDISYDDFIRTTEDRHKRGVRELLGRLYENGDVYTDRYEGLYCVSCEAYYSEEELVEGANCPVHLRPVETYSEENYFFRLSKYAQPLLEHIEAHPDFVYPEGRRNEVVSFIEGGLEDISISRANLTWGIPLPWDPEQVAYVWVDALTNYLSAVGYGSDPQRYVRIWPAWSHLVGKDILRFHAVTWPAVLLAAGIELPRQVTAHGWLLVGGEKMSKTRANQISPATLVESFGSDGYRYHFLRDVPFGPDGNFSWEGMVARYNADLANDLGNLASRVLNLAVSYRQGRVPGAVADGEPEVRLRQAARRAVEVLRGFEDWRFAEALGEVWRFFHAANSYLEATEPWKLAKDPDQGPRLNQVLNASLEVLRVGAVLVSPVLPKAAAELWRRLGLPGRPDEGPLADRARFGTFPETQVLKGEPLFPRIQE